MIISTRLIANTIMFRINGLQDPDDHENLKKHCTLHHHLYSRGEKGVLKEATGVHF